MNEGKLDLESLHVLRERFRVELLASLQLALVGRELIEHEVCSWNELFEKSGLKKSGVSTNTLSSVLKEWIDNGIVEKIEAPFPWRTKYKLIDRQKLINQINQICESTLTIYEYIINQLSKIKEDEKVK